MGYEGAAPSGLGMALSFVNAGGDTSFTLEGPVKRIGIRVARLEGDLVDGKVALAKHLAGQTNAPLPDVIHWAEPGCGLELV